MLIRSYFILLLKLLFKLYFTCRIKFIRKLDNKVIIFDIDNTLADTWPSLNHVYNSPQERLSNLSAFENVVDLINSYTNLGHIVIFMTARNYSYYSLTNRWLKKYKFQNYLLIMVENPLDKVNLISLFKNNLVYYYDDLSYGHESGVINYYDNEIAIIESMSNVVYFGYDYLLKLQCK